MRIYLISGSANQTFLHIGGQVLPIIDHAVIVLLLKLYLRIITMTRLFLSYYTMMLQIIWVFLLRQLAIFTVDAHLQRFLSFVDLGQPDIFVALHVSSP